MTNIVTSPVDILSNLENVDLNTQAVYCSLDYEKAGNLFDLTSSLSKTVPTFFNLVMKNKKVRLFVIDKENINAKVAKLLKDDFTEVNRVELKGIIEDYSESV